MADYNPNYMASSGRGRNLDADLGVGAINTGKTYRGSDRAVTGGFSYSGSDSGPSGLGAPTTKAKEEKKEDSFWDRITNLFTSNDVDVTSVYTPTVNPASVYDSDAFKAPEVSDYVYRAQMSEQTQDLVEQAMGYEMPKAGQLQLLDSRYMTEEEKERLGPLLDLADDISNQNITTTELPPIEGEQQSSLMDALMEGQPTAGLMQRPSVFTGQETRIASTLPDWMQALPLEGFSQALIDIREGRIDRETGQPIVQEEEVDLTPPEAADQELIPTATAGADVAPELDTTPPEQTGLMSRSEPAVEAEAPAEVDDTTSYSMNNKKIKEEYVLGYLADFEGTQAHSSLEGGADTAAYGVKNSMGLDREDFKTDADFAAAVAFKHYNAAGKNFKETNRNIKVWSELGDKGRYAVTDLHYNVGTIGSTGEKSTPKAALENTLAFIGMTAKDGAKVSLISLATRRAKNWNKAADSLGLAKIDKVQQIPTKKGTTFKYLDEDGNSIYTVDSSRRAVSLNSDGSYTVLTETRQEEL